MLDNEPPVNLGDQGGERDGAVTPSVDAAETTTPVRRTRAPRRKAEPPAAQPSAAEPSAAQPSMGEPSVAEADVASPVGDAAEAAPAPVKAAPVKATRSRRKAPAAAPAAASAEPVTQSAEPVAEGSGSVADGSAPVADGSAPVKATRTRRKKAVPAAAAPEEPSAEAEPAADGAEDLTTDLLADLAAALAEAEALAAAQPGTAQPSTAQVPVVGVLPLDDEFVEEQPAPRTRSRRAALPPPVLFMPPDPAEVAAAAAAAPPARSRRRGAAVPPVTSVTEAPAVPADLESAATAETPVADEIAEPAAPVTRSRRRRRGAPAEEPVEVADLLDGQVLEETDESADDVEDGAEDESEDDDDFGGSRRRRRRGRRGRGRGKGPTDEGDDADSEDENDAEAEAEEGADASADAEEEDEETEEVDGVTRRRRRRRRKGSTGDAETGGIEDGVHTVVRVREPRRTSDEVQGVSGSTRLEAKRQRRRDGREQRRTRPPILSESEFLARREAVDRVMVVRQKPDRTQIAVLEDGILVEHYVSRTTSGTMVGNVYLGRVQNVLPSMEAAFIDVGRGRNAVLYAGEVNWDATGLEGRARSIEQALRSGDSVLVQVTKDPLGHKGARLSSHIALSGRHLVYVPNGNASGISRKLPDNERKRLRDVLKKLVPDGAGVIVRTAAEGASEDELARDVKRLQAQWEDIQARAAEGHAPAALSEEPDLVIRVVRDLFNEDFRELIVQGEQAYGELENYLESVSPDLLDRMHRHVGVGDVFAEKRIDEQILKGLDRKVFLPSGGHLVIDRTEAMTVVDVNTGKYTGAGGNLEETVTRNNLEAAEEIVRQLRLRDLGGIVVIDFIDMVLESNRELVLRRLTECLGRDRTKHQVTEITSLGLVQMTRKRIGAGLLEAFSETCDHCKGRGVTIHTEPVPEKRINGGGATGGAGAATQVKAVAAAARTEAPVQQQQQQQQPPAASRSRRRRGGSDSAPIEADVAEVAPTHSAPVSEARASQAPVHEDRVTEARVVQAGGVQAGGVQAGGVQAPVASGGPAAAAADLPPVAGSAAAPVAGSAVAPVAGSGIVAPAVRPAASASGGDDDYDMSGYDLSRYETSEPVAPAEPMRLTGSDDPDAADEDDEDDFEGDEDEPVGAGAGRRRSRRGARRRTRP